MAGFIRKIVLLAVFGYFSYECYLIWDHCQPVVAGPGAKGAKSDIAEDARLDLRLLLSTLDKPPAIDRWPKLGESDPNHVLVGQFTSVSPHDDHHEQPDLVTPNLVLGEKFYQNRSLYLHVSALRQGAEGPRVVRTRTEKLSRQVLQASRKHKRRYLLGRLPPNANMTKERLDDFAEEKLGTASISSLPKVVELGFVTENRELDVARLREKGLKHLVKGKSLALPLFVNTLVSPRDEYQPLLEGLDVSLEFRLRNIGLAYWTLQQTLTLAFDDAEKTYGMNEYDVDSFKQMITGSSPWKITLVYTVAILHLILEVMAVSSDISFWKAKTSFEGISSSSVALQTTSSIIMFLYVREQEQTKMVMYLIFAKFCLQVWKLRKLTMFKKIPRPPYFKWVNRSGAETGLEEMQDIEDFERRCVLQLFLVLVPVMVAYCAYRLVFEKFRSWWSWLILSLAVGSQVGGFAIMTPQIFLNHRLKSVEHLPWRALTFQAVNTFIDDIFTLFIRMPEIHKYSAFRDDIIFIICCAQRWMYRNNSSSNKKPLAEDDDHSDPPLFTREKDE